MNTRDLLPWNWRRKRMTPIRRDDFFSDSGIERDIERVYENFFKDFNNFDTFLPRLIKENAHLNLKAMPKMDLSEVDNTYIIEVELPGVNEKDIDVSLSKEGELTIKGKKENKEETKDRNYYRLECSYGSFERTLYLPKSSNTDNIDALYKDGILTIKIPQKEPSTGEVKKIEIKK